MKKNPLHSKTPVQHHPKVLERPSSQMSYLEHFLKESASSPTSNNNIYNNLPPVQSSRGPKMGVSAKLNSYFDAAAVDQQPPRPGTLPTSPSSLSQPIYSNQQPPPLAHISSPRSNYSFEDRDGVERNFSFSSSRSNASDSSFDHTRHRSHQFVIKSFTVPTKCMHCTSLMVSLAAILLCSSTMTSRVICNLIHFLSNADRTDTTGRRV